jgi:hypothetical protein
MGKAVVLIKLWALRKKRAYLRAYLRVYLLVQISSFISTEPSIG